MKDFSHWLRGLTRELRDKENTESSSEATEVGSEDHIYHHQEIHDGTISSQPFVENQDTLKEFLNGSYGGFPDSSSKKEKFDLTLPLSKVLMLHKSRQKEQIELLLNNLAKSYIVEHDLTAISKRTGFSRDRLHAMARSDSDIFPTLAQSLKILPRSYNTSITICFQGNNCNTHEDGVYRSSSVVLFKKIEHVTKVFGGYFIPLVKQKLLEKYRTRFFRDQASPPNNPQDTLDGLTELDISYLKAIAKETAQISCQSLCEIMAKLGESFTVCFQDQDKNHVSPAQFVKENPFPLIKTFSTEIARKGFDVESRGIILNAVRAIFDKHSCEEISERVDRLTLDVVREMHDDIFNRTSAARRIPIRILTSILTSFGYSLSIVVSETKGKEQS